jgi:hypothetical protein
MQFALLAATLLAISANLAVAGETSVYLKSGWFTWNEKVAGNNFVNEKGLIYTGGIARSDAVSERITISELVEVWGGSLKYEGHDVTGNNALNTDTVYLGTREELAAGYTLPLAGPATIAPFVTLGHKFWVRTRSSEDWNTFYSKVGLSGEMKGNGWNFFARAGGCIPIYTRTHVSLSEAGYADVVTEPKSKLAPFAELGMKKGAFALSLDYEGMSFGMSKKVATHQLANSQSGVAIVNNQAYQPDSEAALVSLKLEYSF